MVAFKGRSPIKLYIPSKPHKWGYKIYCLSSDDYLLHFEIYAGKEDRSADGATYDTVMRMLQGYEDKAYTLFGMWVCSCLHCPSLVRLLLK